MTSWIIVVLMYINGEFVEKHYRGGPTLDDCERVRPYTSYTYTLVSGHTFNLSGDGSSIPTPPAYVIVPPFCAETDGPLPPNIEEVVIPTE